MARSPGLRLHGLQQKQANKMAQVARPIAETDGGALNGLDFSTDEFALTHYTLLHDRERREPPRAGAIYHSREICLDLPN